MKIKIKKDVKTWQYVTFFVTALIILSIGFWSTHSMSQLYLVWIIWVIAICNDYFIVNQTHLKRNWQKVDIQQIHNIVQRPQGLEICYTSNKDHQEKVLHVRPQNQTDMIAKLLEINPNINIK